MQTIKRPALILLALLVSAPALTAPMTRADIDGLAKRTMAAFQVPGMAVGIVKDGKLVLAQGYGVRTLGAPDPVDADTVFAIGSNTKAFTAAALALLVDSGKLGWDDHLIDHLPQFRMSDPWVTREFTVRDMLTHRSGLGLGAGDLLFVTPSDFTRQDILKALQYLQPVSSFRSQFAYDNSMYAVAGLLFEPLTGQSWEDFVTARILQPLHMDGCAVNAQRLPAGARLASPHIVSGGQLHRIPALDIGAVAPAGAIHCNVNGLARWVATQLGHGTSPDGVKLFSEQQGTQMWTPQTLLPVGGKRAQLTHTHFAAYGLGWGLEDFDGYQRVSHNGGLPGMVTHVAMIPELNLGVIVLTNQEVGAALEVMSLSILESYTGSRQHDWLQLAKQATAAREQSIREADAHQAPPAAETGWQPRDAQTYVGTYTDPWRGEATITRSATGLRLTFSHTHSLTGELTPVAVNLFVAHWDDRTLDADAYVRFSTDFSGQADGFTMRAVSQSTDFSFDFQDLHFVRKAQAASSD